MGHTAPTPRPPPRIISYGILGAPCYGPPLSKLIYPYLGLFI